MRGLRPLLAGIFLVSFSLIAFEIALSRLLSVLLSYHYVFAVLAIALLGLGGGGILLHLFPGKGAGKKQPAGDFPFWAAIFSLAVSFSVILGLRLGASFRALDNIFFYGVLFLIPFFFVGILLARIYREFPTDSARIYGFDLVGAGCGSFGCLLLLDLIGVVSTLFLLGVLSSAAALLLAGMQPAGKKKWTIPGVGFVMLLLLFGAERGGFYQPEVPIGKNPAKEIHDVLYGTSIRGEIVETRWSAFGRTDLVKLLDYPDQMDIYLDGTAGSPMYRFSGNAGDPGPTIEGLKTTFPGYFPFLSLAEGEKDDALIIGPGGGRDILLALMGGVKNITAVEVNGDLVDMVRRHSLFNGGIYRDLKNVQVVVEEGRHYLKRHKGNYDLIMLSLPVTNTSRSLEGFALTENFLFTTDAIADYWGHLSEEGRLLIVAHDDIEALRLLSLSLAVLKANGIDEMQAMGHIYMTGSEDYLVFVLKKKPLAPRETAFLDQAMHPLGFNPGISFFPGVDAPLNPVLVALERGGGNSSGAKETGQRAGIRHRSRFGQQSVFLQVRKGAAEVRFPRPMGLGRAAPFGRRGSPFHAKEPPAIAAGEGAEPAEAPFAGRHSFYRSGHRLHRDRDFPDPEVFPFPRLARPLHGRFVVLPFGGRRLGRLVEQTADDPDAGDPGHCVGLLLGCGHRAGIYRSSSPAPQPTLGAFLCSAHRHRGGPAVASRFLHGRPLSHGHPVAPKVPDGTPDPLDVGGERSRLCPGFNIDRCRRHPFRLYGSHDH